VQNFRSCPSYPHKPGCPIHGSLIAESGFPPASLVG
jgi:hypothetical protein